MIALLQMFFRVWQWNNFENRPVLDEVMCRILGTSFLAHPVSFMQLFTGVPRRKSVK